MREMRIGVRHTYKNMEKDELLKSRIEDYVRRCNDGYYVVATKFLDAHEQAIAGAFVRGAGTAGTDVRSMFYGGYDGAERRLLVCIPKSMEIIDEDATTELLQVLHVDIPKGSRTLTHRDYLGSVLGLGIDRSVIGDILVREDGADLIVLPEIADFLLSEYKQVGHSDIKTKIVSINELTVPEAHVQEIKDTIPSARLDNVLSAAFKLSRTKAAEAIRSGIVSVNHAEATKPDMKMEEGDTLVLRGKGKAVLVEVGGVSKKGRIWIRIDKYI